MGQGLHIKVAQVVAAELGVPLAAIRITTTDTSKVPNTSATAASSDQISMAWLRKPPRALSGCASSTISARSTMSHRMRCLFADGGVTVGARRLSFREVVAAAYLARISLSSTGYYRTPKIFWDKAAAMTGRLPFFYFAYGAAVSEVAIDTLTGETQLLRVDILRRRGFLAESGGRYRPGGRRVFAGVGWLTSEELYWNELGQLRTYAPSTYKIPAASDWPAIANVALLERAPNHEETIHRSKAVGEPPLMLAISVLHAIRDACAAALPAGAVIDLPAPATPETVLRAITPLAPRMFA